MMNYKILRVGFIFFLFSSQKMAIGNAKAKKALSTTGCLHLFLHKKLDVLRVVW